MTHPKNNKTQIVDSRTQTPTAQGQTINMESQKTWTQGSKVSTIGEFGLSSCPLQQSTHSMPWSFLSKPMIEAVPGSPRSTMSSLSGTQTGFVTEIPLLHAQCLGITPPSRHSITEPQRSNTMRNRIPLKSHSEPPHGPLPVLVPLPGPLFSCPAPPVTQVQFLHFFFKSQS